MTSYVQASRSVLEMLDSGNWDQHTCNLQITTSNAYWLQHDVQHYRMKYDVKTSSNTSESCIQRNLHLKTNSERQESEIKSLQVKTSKNNKAT